LSCRSIDPSLPIFDGLRGPDGLFSCLPPPWMTK
jgi:hypothetical protein